MALRRLNFREVTEEVHLFIVYVSPIQCFFFSLLLVKVPYTPRYPFPFPITSHATGGRQMQQYVHLMFEVGC